MVNRKKYPKIAITGYMTGECEESSSITSIYKASTIKQAIALFVAEYNWPWSYSEEDKRKGITISQIVTGSNIVFHYLPYGEDIFYDKKRKEEIQSRYTAG